MPRIATDSRPTIHTWSGHDRFVLGYGPSPAFVSAALCRMGDLLAGPWPHPEGWPLDAGVPALPGVVTAARAPGQALSIANGMALAARLAGQSHRVFALLNEPECREGQVWEAALAAAHHHVDNLVVVIDLPDAETESQCYSSLARKWRAFDWQVTLVNGHDLAELRLALAEAQSMKGRPSAILVRTVPGRSVSRRDGRSRGRP